MVDINAYIDAIGETGTVTADMVKDLEDGTYVMAKPLLFHWTLVYGDFDDTHSYLDRWCYADREGAMAALAEFPVQPDGDYEPSGWHRHPASGRRREDACPEAETFAP
jgi:hypothetical protein